MIDTNKLRKDVHQLLRKWHKSNLPHLEVLPNLTLVENILSDYSDIISDEEKLALSVKKVIKDAIDTLSTQEQEFAKLLSRRFLDDITIVQVSQEMNVSEFTISRWQRDGITRVSEIIYDQERELLQTNIDKLEAKLPPQTYQTLIGRTDILENLIKQIETNKLNMLCISGYGGVGKSSLANSIARALISDGLFTDVIWFSHEDLQASVTEEHENIFQMVISHLLTHIDERKDVHLPFATKLQYVRRALRQNPYLIVLDNFNDQNSLTYLVEHLNDIVGRSVFIITSRSRPLGNTATIKTIKGLSQDSAQTLLYSLLKKRGQNADEFTDEDMAEIYKKLGGNPLAITVFASLLDIVSASYVLERLDVVGSTSDQVLSVIDQMWQIISDDARHLLKGMGLVSEDGATLNYMHVLFGQSADSERRLITALGELANYSLIIILGTKEKRYKLHPLTKTFVNRKISGLETPDKEE